MVDIPNVPAELQTVANRAVAYGFTISRAATGLWTIDPPAGTSVRFPARQIHDADFAERLFRRLRTFEKAMNILIDYEQFAPSWANLPYGNPEQGQSTLTTVRQGGCGPTTLATLMQYEIGRASYQPGGQIRPTITPRQTVSYANLHGHAVGRGPGGTRVSAGTDGNQMMNGVHTQWQEFQSETLGGLDAVVPVVREGNLVNFLCDGCGGQNYGGGSVRYDGHFMVLAGVWGAPGSETFYVLDCGGNADAGMETISRASLSRNTRGFWRVTRRSA